MNVLTILIDSLNRHCIGPYGNREISTPNLDRLAARSAVFDMHFAGSLPCMPARRELMTGRKEFFWRGWGALEPFDRPIAREARRLGAKTAIVTDHYHYWENGAHGYLEHFDGVRMVRGHECDMWDTEPVDDASLPDWARAVVRWRGDMGRRYYGNVKGYNSEEDFHSPRTFTEAADWLEKNRGHGKFFLWAECFDVHEPFYVPEPYRSMYSGGIKGDYTVWPPYQGGYHGHDPAFWERATEDEVRYIRSQYCGKVTMTDKWLGRLLDVMDRHGLWETTAVLLTTDHGHELGEKRRFGKQPPNYDLNSHIPLMVSLPGMAGQKRIGALTTAVDLYPTMLGLLGGDPSCSPHGRSLLPLLDGSAKAHREAVVYGSHACGATVTDGRYTYHSGWDAGKEVYAYSANMLSPSPDAVSGKFIPGVDCPVWRMPAKNLAPIPELLFDRAEDPGQTRDLSSERHGAVGEMRSILKGLMDGEGVPPEQYARLGF